MDEKELQNLYNAVSQRFDVGDYNSFKAKMATTDDRKRFYDAVGQKGFDLGDYNQYETRLGGGQRQTPASAKPVQSSTKYDMAALEHAKTNIPVQPQQQQEETIDPNDPLGSTMNHVLTQHQQVKGRIQQLNDIYNRTDLPLPKHPYDAGKELTALNAEQHNLNKSYEYVNNTIKYGAPVSTQEAADELNKVVKKADPAAPDVTKMTPEQIQQYLPKNNLTAQAVLNRYKNNTNVLNNLSTSGSVEQAALRWAKQNPQFFYDKTYQQISSTGKDDDVNAVPATLMGQVVHQFLEQPAAKEYAQSSPDKAQAIQKAQDNLYADPKLKDYGVTQLASYLSQKREDAGLNNGIADIASTTTTDQLAKQALQKGEWTKAMYDAYQKHHLEVLDLVKSPSLLNAIGRGIGEGTDNIFKGLGDLITGKTFGNVDDKDVKDAINEQYKQVQYTPKGWHNLTQGAGEMLGQIVPLMVTTKGLMGLGMSSAAANATAMALQAEYPISQQALQEFPDSPVKREAYKIAMLGINAGFGAMVSREKPLEGLGNILKGKEAKEFTDQVVNTIDQFTSGKISADAAKEMYENTAKGFLDKAADFAGKSLKHTGVMTAQMTGMAAVQDAAEKLFGGRNVTTDDIGNDIINSAKVNFLANLPLGMLAAHSDITGESKIAAGSLWEMTSDPDRYRALINNLAKAGGSTWNAEERIANLDQAVKLRGEMDASPILEKLKPEDKQKYLFQSVAQKVLENQLENTTDNVLRNKIKEQIKQSEAFNQRLIDKTPLEVKEVSKADKEAGVKAYYDDEKNIKKVADKVQTGQPLSDEDLQLQKNFKEELENELNNRAAKGIKAQAKEDAVTEQPSQEKIIPVGKQLELNFSPEEIKAGEQHVDTHIGNPEVITDHDIEQAGHEALKELNTTEHGEQPNVSVGAESNAQPNNAGANETNAIPNEAGVPEDHAAAPNPEPAPEVTEPDNTQPSEAERGATQATPEVTGIKNAVTKAEREARGLSEVQTTELKRSFGQVFDKAKSAVDGGEIDPRAFAQHIAEHPRPLSAEESAALIYDRMRLHNEHGTVMSALEDALQNADKDSETVLRSRLISLEDAINTNDVAARKTGYEQGLGLAIRRQMIQQDYSLAHQLQVMRVANNGEPIPESLRMKLEGYAKELDKALRKIQEHEEKISRLEAERELSGYVNAEKEARRQNRQIKREDNKKVRETAINNIKEKLRIQRNQMNSTPIPVEIIPDLLAIAKSYIKDGILKADEVIEKVHDDVKDFLENVSKRDIRDAISGYGKVRNLSKDELDVKLRDLKGQMREISKLEDLEAKEAPKRSGMQREKPSDELRELRRKVYQKMKEEGLSTRTTEDAQRTALDAVKARLKNQIKDLEKQIETGEKSPKKVGVAYDEEATRLKEERDNLKEALEAIEGKPELSPEQRIKIATAAVEKSIKEYERRIAEKDLSPKARESKTPETEELRGLKAKRDALKADYAKMVEDATPKKSPDEIALQAYKTRLENRKAELEDKITKGDYSTKPRNKVVPDAEALRLQNEVEKLKEKFDLEKRKLELANRSAYEKGLDWLVKWRRGVALTGITTLGKLGSAAAGRIVISPIEELYGGIISKIPGISYIAGKAPREGGFDIHAEAQAISKAFSKETLDNMWDLLKTGKSKEDRLFGKKRGDAEHNWFNTALDFFGRVHSAIKYTAKKAEINRAFEKRIAFAAKNGFDVTDPAVQGTIWSQSYMDANRAIFMNDNIATKSYSAVLRMIENTGGNTGKAVSSFARLLLPIVKVPTNFVLETSHYAFGVPKAAASIAYAFAKGMQNISPEHADYIMRMLKKGSIGAALFTLAYLNPEHFGGYYTGKRDEEDKQPKDMDLYGVTIPHWAQHLPIFEVMQLGATVRRVKDAYEAKHEDESGIPEGALKGAVGLLGETPFFDQTKRAVESFENTKSFNKFFGEFAKSAIDPQIVQQIAEQLDKENGEVVKRKPETLFQHIEAGIPGLRKQVPRKDEDTSSGLTHSLLP